MPPKAAAKNPVKTPKKAPEPVHMHDHDHKLMMDYMVNAKWYSWESPIGLGIFLLVLCLCLMVLAYIAVLLKTTGLF